MSISFASMLSQARTTYPDVNSWLVQLDPAQLPKSERGFYETALSHAFDCPGFVPSVSLDCDGPRADFRGSFAAQGSRAVSPKLRLTTDEASSLLSGLVQANLSTMRKTAKKGDMPILNGIRTGKVRSERLDPDEHWQTWRELKAQISKNGVAKGDCEDLSSAIAAELIFNGVPARTYVYKSGPKLYHVVIKTEPWGLLDPSRAAGMEGNG